jgi:low temperature requirement protein LtrA
MIAETSFTLSRAALRGRSMGVFACTAFGALWASSALSLGAPTLGTVGYAVIALITGSLLWFAIGMLRRSRQMSSANDPAQPAQRRTNLRFLAIFAAEIVLINIAAVVLNHHHALDYLMPTIAIVVGLHFYPLASLFRVPRYHVTATVMTVAGLAGVLGLAAHAPSNTVNVSVDALCALTLWITGVFSWRSTMPVAQAGR